ncbi:MAG: NAD-dependent protein deacylase [Erysipelotrichaceae bacterium]|nr:NAD-dependent protein deacylase [Erysipelotrichaceae bacterium]
MNKYQILKGMIEEGQQIVVFTGAGISVASGIPDFRSADGLYNQKTKLSISPEEIISHHFFENHPSDFYDFYKSKMLYPQAQPNLAHKYFANLEKQGKNVIIITQNIDGLHQEAGSSLVYELHGNVHRNYCEKCGRSFGMNYILKHQGVPTCDVCGGVIKPDVVLYEEPLNEDTIMRAISAIMTCDVLVVVGTSLTVYPAAGFLRYFKGKYLIVINKSETSYDNMCDLVINENIEDVVKKLV